MKQATNFMTTKVAYRGGYVWSVSEDFKRRYGEVRRARHKSGYKKERLS